MNIDESGTLKQYKKNNQEARLKRGKNHCATKPYAGYVRIHYLQSISSNGLAMDFPEYLDLSVEDWERIQQEMIHEYDSPL